MHFIFKVVLSEQQDISGFLNNCFLRHRYFLQILLNYFVKFNYFYFLNFFYFNYLMNLSFIIESKKYFTVMKAKPCLAITIIIKILNFIICGTIYNKYIFLRQPHHPHLFFFPLDTLFSSPGFDIRVYCRSIIISSSGV